MEAEVHVRPPAVAGSFYPAEPGELRRYVETLLTTARGPELAATTVIAPHAGYIYSGPIAASALRCLAPHAGHIQRVVVVGPSHFVAFRGIALPHWTVFRTPLGELMVPDAARNGLLRLRWVVEDDRPHAREHAIEVELPFIQCVLGTPELVPLVVGEASPAEVAVVLAALAGPGTALVVSSDLSHFEPYALAAAHDRRTAEAIERLDESALGPSDACGWLPVAGMLRLARTLGLTARRLDLRSSGDTAGRRDSVVGYGAWAFTS